jgi:hypothetical protein
MNLIYQLNEDSDHHWLPGELGPATWLPSAARRRERLRPPVVIGQT